MTFTLVATAKNEGPYLLEWVAHHRMIGFDHILLYQNDSDDLTREIMALMQDLGLVQFRNNPSPKGNFQIRAYKRAARQPVFKASDWALALDLDEFLFIKTGGGHLHDLMRALPETDEVLLNWRRFGNGGQTNIPDGMVTESFLHAEADARIVENLTPYKAMFRPALFDRPGVHAAPAKVARDEIKTCNGSGLVGPEFDRFKFRSRDPMKRNLAQINHYIIRDAASFVLKSAKGSAHQDFREIGERYFNRLNFNDETDHGLANRSVKLLSAMADIDRMSGGRLGEMQAEALEIHRKKFNALMAEDHYRNLYAFCGGTPPLAKSA